MCVLTVSKLGKRREVLAIVMVATITIFILLRLATPGFVIFSDLCEVIYLDSTPSPILWIFSLHSALGSPLGSLPRWILLLQSG